MGVRSRLRSLFFGRQQAAPVPHRRAGFDAAKTTDENRKHWANADALAPVSQLTPGVRATLRNRARYECENNAYAAGLVRTLVNDTVGRGARLQLLTDDPQLNAKAEDLWRAWSVASDFALTSRIAVGVRYVAGETFAVFRDSKNLDRLGLPVTIDVKLIEPDQVADSSSPFGLGTSTGDDGIECDADGDVVAYRVLRRHPGDLRVYSGRDTADRVPAADVLHWLIPRRPGQLRGETPLAPALPIFAQLRRFTAATLTAAEVAAMLAGVLEMPVPAGEAANTEVAAMDTVEMVRGMLLTLPAGAKASQFKAEHPTTNYEMFVSAKLRECGRCLNVPFGKMAGDHSRYNYSSGRLDDAAYWTDRDVERQAFEVKFLDPFLYRWLDFARFVIPELAAFRGRWWSLKHQWQYDARPTADPVKDATADELNLTNASDSLDAIAARDGTTVEALLDARKRTKEMFLERGLPLPPWLAGVTAPARTPVDGPQSSPQPDQQGAATNG